MVPNPILADGRACIFLADVAMIAVSVVLAAGGNDEPWRYLLICGCLTLQGKVSLYITPRLTTNTLTKPTHHTYRHTHTPQTLCRLFV